MKTVDAYMRLVALDEAFGKLGRYTRDRQEISSYSDINRRYQDERRVLLGVINFNIETGKE